MFISFMFSFHRNSIDSIKIFALFHFIIACCPNGFLRGILRSQSLWCLTSLVKKTKGEWRWWGIIKDGQRRQQIGWSDKLFWGIRETLWNMIAGFIAQQILFTFLIFWDKNRKFASVFLFLCLQFRPLWDFLTVESTSRDDKVSRYSWA